MSSSKKRQGHVSLANQTITVTQPGKTCDITALIPPNASYDKLTHTGEFTVVATPSDCVWTATRETASLWVKITSGSGGAGTGKVGYTINANGAKVARTGRVDVVLTSNKKTKVYQITQGH